MQVVLRAFRGCHLCLFGGCLALGGHVDGWVFGGVVMVVVVEGKVLQGLVAGQVSALA